MQPEPPAPKPSRKRHLVRWTFVVILAILGWYGWKAYDFEQAVKEAKALGWTVESNSPIAIIREDWRNAFSKDTWNSRKSTLNILENDEWEQHFDLIHRLDPKNLGINTTFPLRDLSKFTDLSSLVALYLDDCPNLTNIDALKDMKGLTKLGIGGATGLSNIDALKELKNLEELAIYKCSTLANVDALRELKALKFLFLRDCTGLKNLDGILGLTGLEQLDVRGCDGLTNEAMAAVKVALPNTIIRGPERKMTRPASRTLRAVSREGMPVKLGRKNAEARGSSTFRSRVWAISTGRTSGFSSDADSTLECRATFFAPPSSKVRKAVAVSWHLRELPETMRGQGAGASRPRAPKARNASCPFGTSGAGRPRSLHAPRHSSDPEPPEVPLERIGAEV